MDSKDFSLSAKDGISLSGRLWEAQQPKALLCLIHGLGDHNLRHLGLIEYLVENGITVYAYDQRGHGRSEGKRGHIPSYQALMDDVRSVLTLIKSEQKKLPLFIYGHSFGGNVVGNFTLRYGKGMIDGAVLSSPWLKLGFEPPALQVMMGKIMQKIYPSYLEDNSIDSALVSTDPETVKEYEEDPLVHPHISVNLYLESHEAAKWALEHAHTLAVPTLAMHGDDDQLTSLKGSQEFVEKGGQLAEFKIWENMRHETHNEIGKEKVFEFVLGWLNRQVEKIQSQKTIQDA